MSRRFFILLSVLVLAFPIVALSQTPDRNQSAVLGPRQGLEMSRGEVEKMRNDNQNKSSQQLDVYLFGVSFSLVDSVMFVSDIQKLEDQTVNNRWFLKHRQGYENQFSQWVSGGNDATLVTFVYFSEKEKKVVKKLDGILKKNVKTNNFPVTKAQDFKFRPITAE